MLRAISAIGSEQVLNELAKTFGKNEILIDDVDYTCADIYELIKEDINDEIDIILVAEDVISALDGGKKTFIQKIRELNADVRIAIFAAQPEVEQEFINWAYGYRVYDIYYPDQSASFTLNAIINDLQEGRLEPLLPKTQLNSEKANTKPKGLKNLFNSTPKDIISKPAPIKKSKLGTKATEVMTPKEIIKEVPVEKIVEKIVEKEVIKEIPIEVIKEVPIERIIEKEVSIETHSLAGTFFVGIMNLNPGAGATSIAINLAEELAQNGFEIAVIGADGKQDFTMISGKAHYFVSSSRKPDYVLNLISQSSNYDFVILDFGTLFSLTVDGKLVEHNLTENRQLIYEFNRCNHHFICGSSLPWHINKVNYLLQDKLWLSKAIGKEYTFVYEPNVKIPALKALGITPANKENSLLSLLPFNFSSGRER